MYKTIADTFSITRDSEHFIQIKTLKKPPSDEQLFLAMEIVGDSKYARSTAQKMIETLEESFFDGSNGSAYDRFENALKEINLILKSIKEKRGAKGFGEISAIIAVMAGSELHLTQSKSAEAYLVRRGKFTMISEGLASRGEDLFTNIASGEMMPDDKVVFSTSRLLRLATYSQLGQIFSEGVTESLDSIRELTLMEEELNLGVFCMHVKAPHAPATKLEQVRAHPYLMRAKEFVSGVVEKILTVTGRPSTDINKKTILAALAVAVVLLVISITFLMDVRHSSQLRTEYKMRIEALYTELNTANTKGYANDKDTANAILTKVEGEARTMLEKNYYRSEVLALLDKTQAIRDSINHTERIKDAKPYVDLSTKRASVEALGLTNLDGNFFAFEYNALYEVILNQVLDPKTIDDKEVVLAGTTVADQGVLEFLTQSGRIIEYEDGAFHLANTEDAAWKSAVSISSYGRNIYLLSPENNQIYKYSRLRGKFSSGSEYNLDADLKDAINIVVDGNIYVLKKGGEIIKLYKSNKQTFQISGLAADLSNATKIFTTADLNDLYILDPVAKRVIVVEKGGDNGQAMYKSQIILEGIENVKDIYVNENKLYVLTGKYIYQLDI